MNRTAIRSALSILFYLLLVIAVWAVIGRMLFPRAEQDRYGDFVAAHEALLIQVAENALDEERWPGIRETPEVIGMLAEGGVENIGRDSGNARFYLKDGSLGPEGYLALAYFPEGEYRLPSACAAQDWTEVRTDGETRRWEGGFAGKGYVSARRLSDGFFLEQAYIPT